MFGTPINEITTSNVMVVIKAFCEDSGLELYDKLLHYDKNKEKRVTWSDFQSAIAVSPFYNCSFCFRYVFGSS